MEVLPFRYRVARERPLIHWIVVKCIEVVIVSGEFQRRTIAGDTVA